MKYPICSHKHAIIACFAFVLLFGVQGLRAQVWTYTPGITAEGDTLMYRFPPPTNAYIPNLLVIKFYNGWLNQDSLCYDCNPVKGKDKHIFDDVPFTDCKQNLMTQQFSLDIILDPLVKGILEANGASYIQRLTAANPCTDTISVTRRTDTIHMDHYDLVEIVFDNDTGVIPAIEALFFANPQSVQFPDLVHLMHPTSTRTPCDSEYHAGHQKSLELIGMPKAWWYNVGLDAIKIAIVDNGVDWRRCELGNIAPDSGNVKVTGGWDFNSQTLDSVDIVDGGILGEESHGTACASIAAAFTSNLSSTCMPFPPAFRAWGMAGIAGGWQTACDTFNGGTGAQILAYRIQNKIDTSVYGGQYRSDWAMSAILEASAQSPNSPYGTAAQVINNSYGYTSRDTLKDSSANDVFPGMRFAAAEAYRNAVCFVASKGNTSNDTANWPADFSPQKDIIAVGASDYRKIRESYSSYARTTDLIAPGGTSYPFDSMASLDNIVIAQEYGVDNFFYFSGTSAAAPHVSGVLALMRGFYPYYATLQPYTEDWEGMLESSTQSLMGLTDPDSLIYSSGYDINLRVGWGFLRADSVLELLDPGDPLHYQLFHYTVPAPHSSFGTWDSMSVLVEDDGFPNSLKAGTYPGRRREVTVSANYSSMIDTTKQVYVWGNGGDTSSFDGWSIQSPNSQENWCEVLNGEGGIPGPLVNVREGIYHQQSRTVTAHTFQYEIFHGGSWQLFPDSNHIGISFTVFGSTTGTSSVAMAPQAQSGGLSLWPVIASMNVSIISSNPGLSQELQIINQLGDVVQREMLAADQNEITLDVSKFSEGFYFVRWLGKSSSVETAKFIVRH